MRTETMIMSEAEYIQYELKSERRHEYINGTLLEMPGEKLINNRIAGALYLLLTNLLESKGYHIYINDVKVAIPCGKRYRYPDVCATNEGESDENEYILRQPILLVEVVSQGNHLNDYVDKYIEYTQLPSLEYYLIVEPEKISITVHQRDDQGGWIAHQYTKPEAIIPLAKLNINLPLAAIYKNQQA